MPSGSTSSERTRLTVRGMTCDSCVNTLRRVLGRVPGVTAARVDLAAGQALVEGSASADTLIAAVERAGYEAELSPEPG